VKAHALMLHPTSAKAVDKIVIFKTDRWKKSILSLVMACSCDGFVTVGRRYWNDLGTALLWAFE